MLVYKRVMAKTVNGCHCSAENDAHLGANRSSVSLCCLCYYVRGGLTSDLWTHSYCVVRTVYATSRDSVVSIPEAAIIEALDENCPICGRFDSSIVRS